MLRLMQLERQIQTLEQASRQDKDKIERLELQQNEALEHENLVRELTSEVEKSLRDRDSARIERDMAERLLQTKAEELLLKHLALKDAQMAIQKLEEHISEIGSGRSSDDKQVELEHLQKQVEAMKQAQDEHAATVKLVVQEATKKVAAEAVSPKKLFDLQQMLEEKQIVEAQRLQQLQRETQLLQELKQKDDEKLQQSQSWHEQVLLAERNTKEVEQQLEQTRQMLQSETELKDELEQRLHQTEQTLLNRHVEFKSLALSLENSEEKISDLTSKLQEIEQDSVVTRLEAELAAARLEVKQIGHENSKLVDELTEELAQVKATLTQAHSQMQHKKNRIGVLKL